MAQAEGCIPTSSLHFEALLANNVTFLDFQQDSFVDIAAFSG